MVYLKKLTPLRAKDLTNDEIEKRIALESRVEMIKKNFGFELNWSEIAGLRYYINCFWRAHDENNLTESPTVDAFHYFMVDYFGLDMIELGRQNVRSGKDRKRDWKSYGTGFIGENSFKKYCRMNVNFWRDQRNLI